jgi:hypothetical protein
MFLGPAGRAITFQWYIFIQTRTLVRTEGIITQLVFAHSLRIRLKAEASNEKKDEESHIKDTSSTIAGTPETASIAESSAANSEAGSTTASTAVSREPSTSAASTSSTLKSKAKGPAKAAEPSASTKKENKKDKSKSDDNLIGKINNLVTTDLNNITSGRDFLLLSAWNCPWFIKYYLINPAFSSLSSSSNHALHHILVPDSRMEVCLLQDQRFARLIKLFSAFVGLATMIALVPLPGYVAKLLQDVQRTRMKKV